MALNLTEKQAIVAEVADVAAKAHSAIAAEYRGLSVSQMDKLRAEARKNNVYLRVVKNTLVRRAVEGTDFECMKDGLTGPLVMAFSMEDPGAAARIIKDFVKANPKLEVKLVSISGRLLPATDLETLAKMPTYEQALSLLMSVMKAPAQKLAQTLNEVPGKLVRTLAAVRDAKQAA
ncbi:MAG: 50S ribosomal protein L10 [Gammaproteobacteria bacterium]|nr:50S ribosomal protein L10 [Gammaproteobacteria bacterium]MBU1960850.1 50S ribosomal protein L10 [Gammaproteobacteria bacterium]